MARVEPLAPSKWPKEMRGAMAALTPPVLRHPLPVTEGRPKGLNTLGTFAHHPALAQAFFSFNGHVMMATTLSVRQREILILRVAALRKCAYEWAQHVLMGHDAGLSDDEIGRVAYGPDAPFWDPLDAALILAVDELVADGAITASTWAALAEHLDTQQLLDVIFTIGAYETLAYMFRSFDLPFDDDLQRDDLQRNDLQRNGQPQA